MEQILREGGRGGHELRPTPERGSRASGWERVTRRREMRGTRRARGNWVHRSERRARGSDSRLHASGGKGRGSTGPGPGQESEQPSERERSGSTRREARRADTRDWTIRVPREQRGALDPTCDRGEWVHRAPRDTRKRRQAHDMRKGKRRMGKGMSTWRSRTRLRVGSRRAWAQRRHGSSGW